LIVDETFQFISRPYERGSIILFQQELRRLGEVLGDPVLASAIVDRFLGRDRLSAAKAIGSRKHCAPASYPLGRPKPEQHIVYRAALAGGKNNNQPCSLTQARVDQFP